MPGTIAVTGASGFIGKRLIERLCRDGHLVRALVRHRPLDVNISKNQLQAIRGSLEDATSLRELVADADAVVHLAGLIKARRRQDFFDANGKGVASLINAMVTRQSPAKLVLISSLAAREPGLSSYAASKRCGEAALLDVNAPIPWTVLRPPAVYGQGDRETLPFFKALQRGFAAILGSEQARFSLIHVDDLTDAIVHVIATGCADRKIMELDDGVDGGHSWPSLIASGERALDVSARRFTVPSIALTALGYANAALRIIPGYTPMLTPGKAGELRHLDWVANRRLILEETSWRPTTSIDHGFKATVDWYRLHSWL